MNQKKIIGPEYKDEYKRKHRSKFHEKISRGLFEKDKLLYSFLIVIAKLQSDGTIGDSEWQFFLRGAINYNPKIDKKHTYYTKGVNNWLDFETYKKILCFREYCVTYYDIENILANFNEDDIKKFKNFFTCDSPHTEPLPDALQKITQEFTHLILLKQLREEKLIFAIKYFIEQSFDKRFLESPPFIVSTAYDDSLKTTPLIFILSP